MGKNESSQKKSLLSSVHSSQSSIYQSISQEIVLHVSSQTKTYNNNVSHVRRTSNGKEQTKNSSIFKLPKRKLMILGFSTLGRLLLAAGMSIFNPVFPIEAREKGVDNFYVKLIFGLFYLVVFICSPLFGSYLSKLGPQFVFFSSLYASGVTNLFYAILHYGPGDTSYLVLLLINRSLSAVFRAGYSTVTHAIVLYEFQENMGQSQSILMGGTICGFVVGPALSGFLYDVGGYCLPFYTIGAAILLLAIFAHITLPNLDGSISYSLKENNNYVTMMTLIKTPLTLVALLSCFTGSVGMGNLDSTLTDVLLPFGLSMSMIGLVFVLIDIVGTAGNFAWAYAADSLSRECVAILVGLFMNFIAYALLGPAPFLPFIPHNLLTICIAVSIVGMAYGSILTPVMKCLVKAPEELGYEDGDFDVLSAISGLFTSAKMLGAFFGQFIVGLVGNTYGDGVMFTVIAFTNVVSFVISALVFWIRKNER